MKKLLLLMILASLTASAQLTKALKVDTVKTNSKGSVNIPDTLKVSKPFKVSDGYVDLTFTNGTTTPSGARGLKINTSSSNPNGVSGIGIFMDNVQLWEYGLDYDKEDLVIAYSAPYGDMLRMYTDGRLLLGKGIGTPKIRDAMFTIEPAHDTLDALRLWGNTTVVNDTAELYTRYANLGGVYSYTGQFNEYGQYSSGAFLNGYWSNNARHINGARADSFVVQNEYIDGTALLQNGYYGFRFYRGNATSANQTMAMTLIGQIDADGNFYSNGNKLATEDYADSVAGASGHMTLTSAAPDTNEIYLRAKTYSDVYGYFGRFQAYGDRTDGRNMYTYIANGAKHLAGAGQDTFVVQNQYVDGLALTMGKRDGGFSFLYGNAESSDQTVGMTKVARIDSNGTFYSNTDTLATQAYARSVGGGGSTDTTSLSNRIDAKVDTGDALSIGVSALANRLAEWKSSDSLGYASEDASGRPILGSDTVAFLSDITGGTGTGSLNHLNGGYGISASVSSDTGYVSVDTSEVSLVKIAPSTGKVAYWRSDDSLGYGDIEIDSMIVPSLPFSFATISNDSIYYPQWISNDGLTVYSCGYNARLYKSTDGGSSWTSIYLFPYGTLTMRELDNGELLVTTVTTATDTGAIYVSSGYKTLGTSATWTRTLLCDSLTHYIPGWGLSTRDSVVFAVPYRSRFAYLSTNYGTTWTKVFTLPPTTDANVAHMHGGAYDPYWKALWIINGDGPENRATRVSFDWGATWTVVDSGSTATQFTSVTPIENSILFGTDGTPTGIHRIKRTTDRTIAAPEVVYQIGDGSFDYVSYPTYRGRAHNSPVLFPFTSMDVTHGGLLLATYDGVTFTELWRDTLFYEGQGLLSMVGPTYQGKFLGSLYDGRSTYNSKLSIPSPPTHEKRAAFYEIKADTIRPTIGSAVTIVGNQTVTSTISADSLNLTSGATFRDNVVINYPSNTASTNKPFVLRQGGTTSTYEGFTIDGLNNLVLNYQGQQDGGKTTVYSKTTSDAVSDVFTATLDRAGANGGANMGLGYLFRLEDGGGNRNDAGRFSYKWKTPTNGSETATFTIQNIVSGTMTDMLQIAGDSTYINGTLNTTGNLVAGGSLKINSVGSVIDSAVVDNRALRFYSGGVAYEAFKLAHAFAYGEAINYTPAITQNVYTKLQPTLTLAETSAVTYLGDSLTIQYTGDYSISVNFTMKGEMGDDFNVAIYKNGGKVFSNGVTTTGTANRVSGTVQFYMADLVAGDDISIQCTNTWDNDDPTFTNMSVFLKREHR